MSISKIHYCKNANIRRMGFTFLNPSLLKNSFYNWVRNRKFIIFTNRHSNVSLIFLSFVVIYKTNAIFAPWKITHTAHKPKKIIPFSIFLVTYQKSVYHGPLPRNAFLPTLFRQARGMGSTLNQISISRGVDTLNLKII